MADKFLCKCESAEERLYLNQLAFSKGCTLEHAFKYSPEEHMVRFSFPTWCYFRFYPELKRASCSGLPANLSDTRNITYGEMVAKVLDLEEKKDE